MRKLSKMETKSIYEHILKYRYSVKIINDEWIVISPNGRMWLLKSGVKRSWWVEIDEERLRC